MTDDALPTLAQIFAEAGNTVVPNGDGYRSSHMPIHGDADGHAVAIHTTGWWQCWSCQERGGIVKAAVSLHRLPSPEAGESWLKARYPLTVARLAEDKGLPLKALQSWGLEDVEPGVIVMPYHDLQGGVVAKKRRDAYTARLGSQWPARTKLMPYGLGTLPHIRPLNYFMLVEGESDCWTLAHHHTPVLGIPGANATSCLKGEYLDGISTLYLWQEPGEGGARFVRGIEQVLHAIGWDGETLIIAHPKAKDPTQLHQWDPHGFLKALDDLRKSATKLQPKNPWKRIISVPEFLSRPRPEFRGLAQHLVYPGAITVVAAPRGVCKSQFTMALGVTMSKGGIFRAEQLRIAKVLLLDRDNPDAYLEQSLRGWGGFDAHGMSFLGREDVPSLLDHDAWNALPTTDYDLIIIDSIGSFLEGVTEREGKALTEALSTLRDVAARGPAVLALDNTLKDASVYKGRADIADRVDILYEVRDATDFIPSLKKPWFEELPDASDSAWAARAARRKSRQDYRLAFVPSKFRLGEIPEPFCLEINFSLTPPWSVTDVTAQVIASGEEANVRAEEAHTEKLDDAAHALLKVVQTQEEAGDPLRKTAAEEYLCKDQELKQKEARRLLDEQDGVLWRIVPGETSEKGGRPGNVLRSIDEGDSPPKPESENQGEEINSSGDRNLKPLEPLSHNGWDTEVSVDLDGSRQQKPPPSSPCVEPSAEVVGFCREENKFTSPTISTFPWAAFCRELEAFRQQVAAERSGLYTGIAPGMLLTRALDFSPNGHGPAEPNILGQEKNPLARVEVSGGFEPPEIYYITSAAALQAHLPHILEAPVVGIDTETTGLNPQTDRVCTIQLATHDRTMVVNASRVPVELLAPVFDGRRWLIAQHAEFDWQMLVKAGLPYPAGKCFDPMLGAMVLNASRSYAAAGTYALEGLAEDFLRVALDKTQQTSAWDQDLSAEQIRYAALDAAILLPLTKVLQQRLKDASLWRVAELEGSCTRPVAWLELAGMPVDREAWAAQAQAQTAVSAALAADLNSLVGVPVNWQSPKQILALLKDRGVVVDSTGEEVLAEHVDDPLVRALLEYRHAAQLVKTFGEKWLRHVDPTTGRVHADFHQLGSVAGRFSCSKPNLQQIPRLPRYRAMVRVPEHRRLIKADYGQIELRIAAIIAPDHDMLERFLADEDIHIRTAASILSIAPERVTTENRQLAKALNFGLLFGMGAKGLRTQAWKDYRVALTEAEAVQRRQQWLRLYKGIERWHRRTGQHKRLDTRTLLGRRRLGITRFTEMLNTPVQGSGADGFKLAMVRIFDDRYRYPDVRLVNVVHDELLFECDALHADEVALWVKCHMEAAMQEVVQGKVPTPADVTVGHSWAG